MRVVPSLGLCVGAELYTGGAWAQLPGSCSILVVAPTFARLAFLPVSTGRGPRGALSMEWPHVDILPALLLFPPGSLGGTLVLGPWCPPSPVHWRL